MVAGLICVLHYAYKGSSNPVQYEYTEDIKMVITRAIFIILCNNFHIKCCMMHDVVLSLPKKENYLPQPGYFMLFTNTKWGAAGIAAQS